MRSGTELSPFLRIYLPTLLVTNIKFSYLLFCSVITSTSFKLQYAFFGTPDHVKDTDEA